MEQLTQVQTCAGRIGRGSDDSSKPAKLRSGEMRAGPGVLLPRHGCLQDASGHRDEQAGVQSGAPSSGPSGNTCKLPAALHPQPRPPESAWLSNRGPLARRLLGQGLPQMLPTPRQSVLMGYELGPSNGRMIGSLPYSGQGVYTRRQPNLLALEAKDLPQLQTTLREQLAAAWRAVGLLLQGPEVRPLPEASSAAGHGHAASAARVEHPPALEAPGAASPATARPSAGGAPRPRPRRPWPRSGPGGRCLGQRARRPSGPGCPRPCSVREPTPTCHSPAPSWRDQRELRNVACAAHLGGAQARMRSQPARLP